MTASFLFYKSYDFLTTRKDQLEIVDELNVRKPAVLRLVKEPVDLDAKLR